MMMNTTPRLLRITTVPISLKILLQGQLSFFKQQGFDVCAVSSEGQEVESIRAEGIDHVTVVMTRKITPFRDLLSLFQLIRVMRKFRPDIVHTHTPKAGLLGMFASWLCRIPIRMHTVAGLPLMEAKGLRKAVLVLAERATYACATRVYPNSKGLKEFIVQYLKPKTPVLVIGQGSSNGIDTAHFTRTPSLEGEAEKIRRRYGVQKSDIVFSFAGRLVKDKGIGELVKAFKSISQTKKQHPRRIFLMLIGPLEQDLDPLREEDLHFINESKNVLVAGFQHDVRPWIMASDIFVFPSYREGFPNVVMQASCLEVPCIVSNINGCNEIIRDHDTGLVVPPKDPQALAVAMEELLENANLRRQYGQRSRDFVVRFFDRRYVWGELLKEYREALSER
jgi:glycosyltransferase involved in cell wall biosynthesis